MEGDLGVVWRNSLLPVNDLEGLEFLIQCRQRCASAPNELNSCGSHVRVWDLVSCPAAAPIREGTSGTSVLRGIIGYATSAIGRLKFD